MAKSIVAQTADLNNPHNGVIGVDTRTYHIYVDGKHVDTAYGTEFEAQEIYQEWQQAISADENDLYIDTPVDEVPDSFWKNGHIAPLKIEAPQTHSILVTANGQTSVMEVTA